MLNKIYLFFASFFTRRYLSFISINKLKYNPSIIGYVHDDVTRNILNYGHHEYNIQTKSITFIIENYIKNLDTLIDCGANIGTTAINLNDYFKKIYCIEPLKNTFNILKMNTIHYKNIECINVLLSDKEDKYFLSYDSGYLAGASVNSNGKYKEKVYSNTLDKIFKNINFKNLCIKMDIEGNEYKALLGSKDIIARYKPIFFIEINNSEIRNGTSKSFNLLKNLNYEFFNYEYRYTGYNRVIKRLPYFSSRYIKKIEKLDSKHLFGRYRFLICVPKK